MIANNTQVDTIIADVPYNIKYDEWDKQFDIEKAIKYFPNLSKFMVSTNMVSD